MELSEINQTLGQEWFKEPILPLPPGKYLVFINYDGTDPEIINIKDIVHVNSKPQYVTLHTWEGKGKCPKLTPRLKELLKENEPEDFGYYWMDKYQLRGTIEILIK